MSAGSNSTIALQAQHTWYDGLQSATDGGDDASDWIDNGFRGNIWKILYGGVELRDEVVDQSTLLDIGQVTLEKTTKSTKNTSDWLNDSAGADIRKTVQGS